MIQIIPAIDIIEGKCVRLIKGDYQQKKVYNEDPVEVAKTFEDHGLMRLHLVDLDGAREKHVINWKVLKKIATKTGLVIDFGGGIKTDEDIRIVFENGARMATIGSVAIKEKELFKEWLEKYGPEKIILGADVNDRKIAVSGWMESTDIELFDFLKDYLSQGIEKVLCTDISKDGMLEGASLELYREIQNTFQGIELIASGGVTTMDEIVKLDQMDVHGVIIGKAIYEGKIKLDELQRFIID